MPYITFHVDLRGVPHSFVTLHDADGNMQHYGYGPAAGTTPVAPGRVFVGYDPNKVKDSAGNFAEVSYSQTTFITQQQYDATLTQIADWQSRNTGQPGGELYVGVSIFGPILGALTGNPGAGLAENNCNTFVSSLYAAAGLPAPGGGFHPAKTGSGLSLSHYHINAVIL